MCRRDGGGERPCAAVRRRETDSSWEDVPAQYRRMLDADMRSIWDIREMLAAKEDQRGNRDDIFHRCYTTFNAMTNRIITQHGGILKSNMAALHSAAGTGTGMGTWTRGNAAVAAMLPGYMSLIRLKESIGIQRAYVSGLVCLPRHFTTPQNFRDTASAAEAGLEHNQAAFTAMDTCKEIFKCVGSQKTLRRLFHEMCLDEDILARFKYMEDNVPATLVSLRQSMGTDPFRGLTEVGAAAATPDPTSGTL